jgi:hypothetical protein
MICVRRALRPLLLALALLGLAAGAQAATTVIVNNDDPGEGFNDATAATPVGGNSGTTVGAQRLIAFQYAADIWGARLSSVVPIRIGANFDALECDASGGVLGQAGPETSSRDFIGAPVSGTWYPIALANALNGNDLAPGVDDIGATFNSMIGTSGCMASSGWYYGLDGNPPNGKIDFVSVLLHELGHGLGFLSFVNLANGQKALGFDDAYMRHLIHHGATPEDFPSMTAAQRLAAMTATGNLHWAGPEVRASAGMLTSGAIGDHVRMYAPNPSEGGSSVSHWDTVLSPSQLMEPSYTGVNHDPDLEVALFKDIGWPLVATATKTLSVVKAGTGSGTITSTPGGIICPGTCSTAFTTGIPVTLTAAAAGGSTFLGWSAPCSGTGTCLLSMTGERTVTATFGLADDGFPEGGSLPAGYSHPGGSNAPWIVASDSAYAGSNSLKSGVIGHSQRSDLAYTASFAAGTVSFARRVSSEQGYDFLHFYIDGALQGSWSGEVAWSVVSFPIGAGTHTLTWRYVKDNIVANGFDAAWIDSVSVPVVTVPGAPTGVSVLAGAGRATVSFSAPASNGGSPITSYTVTCVASGQPTLTATGAASPILVLGMVAFVSYSCSVTATNANGEGTASPASEVTPLPNTDIVPLLLLLLE